MNNEEIARLAQIGVSARLNELRPGFIPGTQFTFIARHPDFPDEGVILSEDSMEEVEKFVRKWSPSSRQTMGGG